MVMFRQKRDSEQPPARTPEGIRLYAIGDIHGRFDLLTDLMAKIRRDAYGKRHRVVFLGDYIDRGPGSAEVLDYLIALQHDRGDAAIFLKGNHEQAMLDFIAAPEEGAAWLEWGGAQTLESYGLYDVEEHSPEELRDRLLTLLPDSHFNFLMSLKLHHQEADYTFVHAGMRGGRPLEAQREEDLLWIRDDFFRAGAKGFAPGCIVHGHTPVEDRPVDTGWRINVDTGAVWTGQLTAVVLDGAERRYLATGRRVTVSPEAAAEA